MHHTEHTITVDASAEVVFDVLADIEGYATLFPPTRSATILEEGPGYQIARLVVDVSGQDQQWVTRRDLNPSSGVISYGQTETAPLVAHMSGEWRCLPLGARRTQLVLTHDFEARQPAAGQKVAGRFSAEEADKLLIDAVERNSRDDLSAVQIESERRTPVTASPTST